MSQDTTLKRRARIYAMIVATILDRQGVKAQLKDAYRGARHLSLGVRLADATTIDKALKQDEAIATQANVKSVIANRDYGLVIYQFELRETYWQSYTRADLPDTRAIGLGEKRAPILFELDPPHILIAGTTGAGKTETIKSGLMRLMLTHSPDELGIVLIDPHQDYGSFDNASHLILKRAITADDITRSILWCNQELAQRKRENNRDGKKIVLVIDEAAADEVLADDRNLAIVQNIASQARKFKMHAIVGTQKPSQKKLPDVIDKLNNKYIGRVDDARQSAAITGQAGLAAHKLTFGGDFLHVNGPEVKRLQVAMVTPKDYAVLPRGNQAQVEVVEPADMVILPPEPQPVGRPSTEIEPDILAHYWRCGAKRLGAGKSYEALGLTKYQHYQVYKPFIEKFAQKFLELRRMKDAC